MSYPGIIVDTWGRTNQVWNYWILLNYINVGNSKFYLGDREMKEGKFAVYLGKEYTSGMNREGKIILRSTDMEDINKGFEACEPFQYRKMEENIVCVKFVQRSEVEEYYKIRIKALYSGYEFEVMEEKNNEISIAAMTGDYRVWEEMGMKCIDKGVYQKWINKDEAEIKIIKENLLKV